MKNEILSILRCPITNSVLRVMSKGEVEKVNKKIRGNNQFHLNGLLAKKVIKQGLISEDGNYVYPVIDGIIILDSGLSAEKETVVNFYNQIGWKKVDNNLFADADKYEDLRPVMKDYIHNCHLRVNKYLKNKGKFLLDAGSGPIQYKEYFTYSKGYKYRVCVDISFLALKEAKKRLGDKGIYILADLTKLPFKDNCFDGAVSLHVIYHIPIKQQKNAISEIYRTLSRESNAVIVYSRPAGFNLLVFMGKLARKLKIIRRPILMPKQDFYFQPLDYRTFVSQQNKNVKMKMFVWRSVGVLFGKKYIHPWLFGKQIMKLIFAFENIFPWLFGRLGQYPLFVLKK